MTYEKCPTCGRDADVEVKLFTSSFFQCPQPCIGADGFGGRNDAPSQAWTFTQDGRCDNPDCLCNADPAEAGQV
jgi:hypothetical protein